MSLPSNYSIRTEAAGDHEAVYELNKHAFRRENEADLVEALRKSDAFIPALSLVAVTDEKIVGHILFTRIKIIDEDGCEAESLALAPMAVLSRFRNKGIGSLLISTGLKIAAKAGYKSAIVLGHEDYYPKFGFEPAEKWDIRAPFDVPSEVFMAIELLENGLKNVSGTVHFSKEFEAV